MSDMRLPQQHGILVLDKPKGPSSAGCLEQIKRGLGQRKIGHAGTLDPMASGVLLALLGQATKIAQFLSPGYKTYAGELKLGTATNTYDMEGEVVAEAAWDHLTSDQVRETVLAWQEDTEQTVPPYSAAKHQGKPLYRLSRQGLETPLKIKPLEIFRVEVLGLDLPLVRFRISCGAGTYIRSLVHSLGMRLGCGAVLTELIRERSHPFSLDQAVPLARILGEPEKLPEWVVPLGKSLPHLPSATLDDERSAWVRNGVRFDWEPGQGGDTPPLPGEKILFLDPAGDPLAIAESRPEQGRMVWATLRGLWQ